MTQEEIKPIYKNAVKTKVNEITIETRRNTDNNLIIKRLRLKTDLGDITYKPKKKIEKKQEIKGFSVIEDETDFFTIDEFLDKYPFIEILAKNSNEKPQEIVLSYAEFTKKYEDNDKEVTYRFMRDYQFETVYYPEVHSTDKRLKKMEEWKNRNKEEKL